MDFKEEGEAVSKSRGVKVNKADAAKVMLALFL